MYRCIYIDSPSIYSIYKLYIYNIYIYILLFYSLYVQLKQGKPVVYLDSWIWMKFNPSIISLRMNVYYEMTSSKIILNILIHMGHSI